MNVPDFDAASELIIGFESFRPFPYDDAHPNRRFFKSMPLEGTLTIGFGNTDPAVVLPFVESGGEMTREEALADFRRILPGFWKKTSGHFTTALNGNQCAALTSLSYNAGPAGIRVHAPALLAAINEGRFADAAELWKSSIINAGTKFETGLRRRRAAEAALFATAPRRDRNPLGADMDLPTEFTYILDGVDFLWLGPERIHTRCASADVLEGLKRGGQIVGLGKRSAQFHAFLRSAAENANFAIG